MIDKSRYCLCGRNPLEMISKLSVRCNVGSTSTGSAACRINNLQDQIYLHLSWRFSQNNVWKPSITIEYQDRCVRRPYTDRPTASQPIFPTPLNTIANSHNNHDLVLKSKRVMLPLCNLKG